ncbi:hypothetical protein HAV1_gp27 [Hyperthermophilic Archaeal Virus 1]|uniref:hypothetical protein n=1 Tax=Hyperthermophilic Archaeal Virus 1 TaxID=762905 RepID=UPI0001DBAE06|nr:hypothetical protein HAV1_gp27 [Hyperthermophilic Archaeal Virus 1]ADJ54250.1 hypothetical protein HAV1_gp27 [Hyperthermophilic Archaeal Virus 1]
MSMISQCTKQKTDNGVLYVEIDLDCMVKSMNVPIKDVKYRLNGGMLTIEVVPDVESILNTVLNR